MLSEPERRFLVAAAYLHDVGYAPSLRRTGLHQLDGAHYVRSLGQERLASLIAHYSESRFELQLRGFRHELDLYKRKKSWTADALTYCDLTTGPLGQPMTLEERIAEVEQRYGQGDIVGRVISRSTSAASARRPATLPEDHATQLLNHSKCCPVWALFERAFGNLEHDCETLLDGGGDAPSHLRGGMPVVSTHRAPPLLSCAAAGLMAHHLVDDASRDAGILQPSRKGMAEVVCATQIYGLKHSGLPP
jgi:hypothetical protein